MAMNIPFTAWSVPLPIEGYETETAKASRLQREADAAARRARAEETANKRDDLSDLRKSMSERIYNLGGTHWLEKWLLVRDIEDMIDAKIAASKASDGSAS